MSARIRDARDALARDLATALRGLDPDAIMTISDYRAIVRTLRLTPRERPGWTLVLERGLQRALGTAATAVAAVALRSLRGELVLMGAPQWTPQAADLRMVSAKIVEQARASIRLSMAGVRARMCQQMLIAVARHEHVRTMINRIS
jgi:hypothetical protein